MQDDDNGQGRRTTRGRDEDGLGTNSDIGSKLRALYSAAEAEPIPDKFLDLLEKLDLAERATSDGPSSQGGAHS